MSNKNFSEILIERCEFINSKLLGVSFIDSSIKDVYIDNTLLKYTNYSGAFINKLLIENSNLAECYFIDSKIKNINFFLST